LGEACSHIAALLFKVEACAVAYIIGGVGAIPPGNSPPPTNYFVGKFVALSVKWHLMKRVREKIYIRG